MRQMNLAVALLVLSGCSRPAASVSTGSEMPPIAKMTTSEQPGGVAALVGPAGLFGEYEANTLAADLKYKGKLVRVKGRIVKVGEDKGKYFAGMGAFDTEDLGESFPSVVLFIKESEQKKFAAIKRFALVTVEGIGAGKGDSDGSVKGWSVIVDQCRLIGVEK